MAGDNAEPTVRATENSAQRLRARYLPRLIRWLIARLPPGHEREGEQVASELFDRVIASQEHSLLPNEAAFLVHMRQEVQSVARPYGASPLIREVGFAAERRYEEALWKLKPEDRETVIASVEMSLGYEEVAGLFGESGIDAGRARVSRAVRRLAEEMAQIPEASDET